MKYQNLYRTTDGGVKPGTVLWDTKAKAVLHGQINKSYLMTVEIPPKVETRCFNINRSVPEGFSIETVDGRPVRILGVDRKSKKYPVVGLIDLGPKEQVATFTEYGTFQVDEESNEDLVFIKRN